MTKIYDYELVYNYIFEQINVEYFAHDKIPSESELCKEFSLSKLTVRQGINKLKNEGYLYSRQGSGNFVSPKKIVYKISPYTTFSNTMRKFKQEPKIKLLEKKLIKADAEIAEKLSVRKAEKVLYVKVMRLADDVPFLYSEYYLNLLVLKGIEEKIENIQSFSELYKELSLQPIRDNSEIDITSTNYQTKKIFQVQNDMPIIKISTKTIDEISKKTIDYCHTYFRSDLMRISIDYNQGKEV